MSITALNKAAAQQAAAEFLTFKLGAEEYGIDILKVQELRGYDAVTKIANAPDFIKGVINLRGAIVPILDVRRRWNLGEMTYGLFTVVIILNIRGATVGLVVDSVSDVITLPPEAIKPAPELGNGIDTEHLIGLGTLGERLLILIDIERVLAGADMLSLEKIAA